MASATPDLRLPSQPHGITLPLDRYRTILLGDIEAHVCEQLAQGCYLKVERPGIEPATFDDALTITSDTPPRDSGVIL